jgi:16S rRNA G966 N2-methylase RsmD
MPASTGENNDVSDRHKRKLSRRQGRKRSVSKDHFANAAARRLCRMLSRSRSDHASKAAGGRECRRRNKWTMLFTHWEPTHRANLHLRRRCASFLRSIYLLQFDARQTLIYLDPPYLMSVRSSKQRIYANEFHTEAEHRELLKLLKKMPQMVMISAMIRRFTIAC